MPLSIDANVPLAPRTTLELGGRARWLAHATSEAEVVEALDWAAGKAVPVAVLAGGSNTIIPDDGFPGLVLVPALRGLSFEDDRAGAVRVTVGAGEPWDALVQETVARDLAGLECLSGIPGSAGATPIQNVGAYGQEVSETVREVRVLRVRDRATETRTPTQCGFAYRDSAFKRDPGKVIVLVVSLSFYGMSTFEGPMMAIKTVNALSHYTDWTIGHVHSGALGWVAMVSIGAMYHLIPIMYGRKYGDMHSIRLINVHFWLATIGTVLYIASMWVNGLMQGLMWRAFNNDGTLTYSFVESVEASYPGYIIRAIGGALFLIGMLIMAYNTWKTMRADAPAELTAVEQPA